MKRLLCIGDPHFQVKNTEETQIFVNEVNRWLLENGQKIDAIVILGDVLHNHETIYTFPLNQAIEFFEMCSSHKLTYILVGNHDMTSNTVFLEPHHWMNSFKKWKNVVIVDVPTMIADNILAIPYVPNGRMKEALDKVENWQQNCKLIIGHQLLNGAKMGAIIETNVEEWQDDYPLCISGHIHDKQWVKHNLFYSGSSMQHAFGESHNKSLTLVEVPENEGSCVIEEIYLNIKLKEIVHVTVDELQKIMEQEKDKKSDFIDKKLVIKDDPDKIAALKQSAAFKELEQSKLFTRIQCKTKAISDDQTLDSNIVVNSSFESLVMTSVIMENDPYLLSFAKYIMYGQSCQDQSKEDVVFFGDLGQEEMNRLIQENNLEME